jgi:hypothetical protein
MSIGGDRKDMVVDLNQTSRRSVEGNLRKGNQEGRPVLFTMPEIKLRDLVRSEEALRAECNKPRQTTSQCEFVYIHVMKAYVGVAA